VIIFVCILLSLFAWIRWGAELNCECMFRRWQKKEVPSTDFFTSMQQAAESRFDGSRNVSLVQKKINLADEFLAWEHERYNIRKLRAFTLSHFDSHKDPMRMSILDRRSRVDVKTLRENVEIIAEALLRQLYDIPASEQLNHGILNKNGVQESMLSTWLDILSAKPRGSQMMTEGGKDPIVADLLNALDHHTHEAILTPVNTDKKDPEFVLYGATEDLMFAHMVKPAIFDLLLAAFIAGYLGILYLAVLNFHGFCGYIQLICDRMIKAKNV